MAPPSFLKNRYWVLRHGKSIPNEKGLIVSSLVRPLAHQVIPESENGILEKYKLASEGVSQARLAGELFLKELEEKKISLGSVRICYSPFSRTKHTAEVVAAVLNIPFDGPQCKVIGDLRERFFGPSFELQSHDKYQEIWDHDEKDPFKKPEEGGESVSDVVTRLTCALSLIEQEFQGCAVLVVCHGDPLQILQTILHAAKERNEPDLGNLVSTIEAVKVPSVLSRHRTFSLNTGELRAVVV